MFGELFCFPILWAFRLFWMALLRLARPGRLECFVWWAELVSLATAASNEPFLPP